MALRCGRGTHLPGEPAAVEAKLRGANRFGVRVRPAPDDERTRRTAAQRPFAIAPKCSLAFNYFVVGAMTRSVP
jgi:hypothetical protein